MLSPGALAHLCQRLALGHFHDNGTCSAGQPQPVQAPFQQVCAHLLLPAFASRSAIRRSSSARSTAAPKRSSVAARSAPTDGSSSPPDTNCVLVCCAVAISADRTGVG